MFSGLLGWAMVALVGIVVVGSTVLVWMLGIKKLYHNLRLSEKFY